MVALAETLRSLFPEQMNTYSHLVLANEIKPSIQPDNDEEYYWGAITPDIRNLVGMRRSQTHLSSEQILTYMAKYPHLEPFLQGYLVHCLTDELDLVSIFNRKFPFCLLKKRLTAQHYPVILELFYLEQKNVKGYTISGRHNSMMEALGINVEQSHVYYRLVNEYLEKPSFEAAFELIKNLGNPNSQRIDRYLASARHFQANRVLKGLMFLGIRVGKIHNRLVEGVQSTLQGVVLPK
jgi:hypothetical protein